MKKTALVLSLVLALASLSLGCQAAFYDGAWSGTLECNNVDYDIDAHLEQSLERETIKGSFFIEYEIDLGLFGRHRIWEKGTIDEGEWDPSNDSIRGRIDPIDNQANNQAPEWRFELEPNQRYDAIVGELEAINNDGDVYRTCDAELEPVVVEGN